MTHQEDHPHDIHLLRQLVSVWRKMARIIGTAIGDLDARERDELRLGSASPLDLLFAKRLIDLAEQERLEYKGDLTKIGLCELRLLRATLEQSN
jgi:hypothetical protein